MDAALIQPCWIFYRMSLPTGKVTSTRRTDGPSTSPRIFIIWWDVFFFKTRQTGPRYVYIYICEGFFLNCLVDHFFLSLKKHPKFRKNGSNVSNLSRFDDYTPQKLTWNRKKWMVSKRNILFKSAIFRFHLQFWEGITVSPLSTENPFPKFQILQAWRPML